MTEPDPRIAKLAEAFDCIYTRYVVDDIIHATLTLVGRKHLHDRLDKVLDSISEQEYNRTHPEETK